MKRRKISKRSKKVKNRIIQKKEKKTTNMLNVGALMRKYSGGKNVSPSAVTEMIKRIDIFLENAMPDIARIAEANGCKKTIKEHEDLEHPEKSQAHITWYFSLVGNDVEHVAFVNKKGYRWELIRIKEQNTKNRRRRNYER